MAANPGVPKRKKKTDLAVQQVSINYDIAMLDIFIRYMQCSYVNTSQILNLYKLMARTRLEDYEISPDIQDRLRYILRYTEAKALKSITDDTLIHQYIGEVDHDIVSVIEENNLRSKDSLSTSECAFLNDVIVSRLQCLYIYEQREEIMNYLDKLESTDVVSVQGVLEDFKAKLAQLLTQLQNTSLATGAMREFHFSSELFMEAITTVVEKSKRPLSSLFTGIQQLNAILSPAFLATRVYVFIGKTGGFKSGTLLNVADSIRQNNPQINAVVNGRRKTILYLTLENSIEETLERLYDMYEEDIEAMRYSTVEQVVETLREKGQYTFQDTTGIDIDIRKYENLEISTADIYAMIKGIYDDGREVICVIIDYILKLDSSTPHYGDEKLRLENAMRELKALAQWGEIPVITAMQLNRDGNSIIDAAVRDNKSDVAQFVGVSSVGLAFGIIQEADWVCLINLEIQQSTGQTYLTFKRLKIRYAKEMRTEGGYVPPYFNHPFTNAKSIRLAPDIHLEKPLSVMRLASDLSGITETEAKKKRPKIHGPVTEIREKDPGLMAQLALVELPTPTNIPEGEVYPKKKPSEV